MRIILLSDVHSNLPAFEKVLKEIEKIGYDEIWFLGDIVGYGAEPNECVELLKNFAKEYVSGNHDWAVNHPEELMWFNENAQEVLIWTTQKLKEENKIFLKNMPIMKNPESAKDKILIVHSSPYRPYDWIYITSYQEIKEAFENSKEWLVIFGHTHIPVVYLKEDDRFMALNPYEHKEIELDEKKRYLINPGSVGQPRDGIPDSSFALLDLKEKKLKFYRVPYDIEKEYNSIINSKLPFIFAERLFYGR